MNVKFLKRFLFLALCLMLLIGFVSAGAAATETAENTAATANSIANGTCGENLTWTLTDSGTLIISGIGAMRDYSSASGAPWYASRTSVTTIIIEEGVTCIGWYAFEHCSNMTNIMIPDSVTSIGGGAFNGCTSLESIVVPDSVTSIGYDAFRKCTSLTTVTIGNSVTSIGTYVFYDCTSLTDVTIGNSVISIGMGAFSGCTSLTGIVIPESVKSLGHNAFNECTSLTSIDIPNSITSIGEYAFDNCTSLESIVVPDSVTSIDGGAFYGCSSLTEIRFEGDAPSMSKNTFYGVTATAYYPSGNTTWTSDKLKNYYGTLTWVAYDVCHHSYEITITKPTCEARGYTTHTCALCGYSYKDTYVAALGHRYGDWTQVKVPDCTAEGEESRSCSVCRKNESRSIPAMGHSHEAAATPPTCTEQGYTTYTCTACGDSYVDTYVEALGHTPGEAIRENEEPNGAHDLVIYCERCGQELSREHVEGELPTHIPGDINGDGEVDNKDLTRLFRYLSGFNVEIF